MTPKLWTLRTLLLLALVSALGPTLSAQQPQRLPVMEDLLWDSRSSYTRFITEFSVPSERVQYQMHNLLPDQPAFYIDFYDLRPTFRDQVVDIGDGMLQRIQIVNYTDRNVVRFIFYIQDVRLFNSVSVSAEGYQLQVDILRRQQGRVSPLSEGPMPTDERQLVVIIDPGHGGSSSGARSAQRVGGEYVEEKDVVLAISHLLARELNETGRFRVYMTRTGDEDVSLDRRVEIAQRLEGDFFISIHANHAGDPRRFNQARGLELFYLSRDGVERHSESELEEMGAPRSSERQLRRVVMSQGDRMRAMSIDLCGVIARSFMEDRYWRPEDYGGEGHFRYVKGGNLHVLRNFDMPCILVETGYMTHPEEVRLLLNHDFQERIAENIVRGLQRFIQMSRDESIPAG